MSKKISRQTAENGQSTWPANKVEQRPLGSLTPYPQNARTHSEGQIAQIAASMQEWGWTNPVLVDEGGSILAGHGRVLAASKLGYRHVPVIVAFGWSDAQKRAYILADNQLALNAGWDIGTLKGELKGLRDWGFDLDLLGFDNLAALLRDPKGLTDPDDTPALEKISVAALGDTWLLGEHRLFCGDATKRDDVAQLMGGETATLFSTDPPYVVDYTGADRPNDSGKDWSDCYKEVEIKDAAGFLRSAFTNATDVLEDNAAWYCWHAHKRAALIEGIWSELGVLNHQQIVWVKPSALHSYSFYPWRHEPCLMGWKQGSKPHHDGDNTHSVTSVWSVDWEGKARIIGNEHPTQKPVELFAIPMRKHTLEGQICFEPFCGSGSQIVAGERLGRRVFAMDLEPTFIDVAIKRWQSFTGKEATLDGATFAEVQNERLT